MNSLFEVTSSGLTEWDRYWNIMKRTDGIAMITLDSFAASPSFYEINYGVFEIPVAKPVNDTDIVVTASIRGFDGAPIFSKDYSKSDLRYDDVNLRYNHMCEAKLNKQLVFVKLIYWSKLIFLDL